MNRAVDLSPAAVIIALMWRQHRWSRRGILALPLAALAKILVEEFIVKERLERVRDEVTLPSERQKGGRGTGKARPLP